MTSMAPSRPARIMPTAARSRVGTSSMVAAAGAALIGHGGECVVLLPGGRERKHARGILGPAPEGVHRGRKIARALNRFERHGHGLTFGQVLPYHVQRGPARAPPSANVAACRSQL